MSTPARSRSAASAAASRGSPEYVNIIEIYHQRIFTTLPAKGLTAEIECEARDGEQIDRLVDNLRAKGYSVELAELA